MKEWISVEEKLPEVGDDVLIVDHGIGGDHIVKIATFINGTGSPNSGGRWIVENKPWVDPNGPHFHYITHWMPLPPPPERP